MRPWLLRPPVPVWPSVRPLTGLPFHRPVRSISTVPRRLAVTGLKFFIGIVRPSRQSGGEIDLLARRQPHQGLLHVRTNPRTPLGHLALALVDQRVDGNDRHAEQALHRGLDLRLARVDPDPEHILAMLGELGRLLGDDRIADQLIHRLARQSRAALGGGLAHAASPSATPDGAPTPSRAVSPARPEAVIAST